MNNLTAILQQNNRDTSTFAPVVQTPSFVLSAFAVHGDQAGSLWFDLYDIRRRTGHCPVILGDDNDLHFLREEGQFHARKSIPDIIAREMSLSPRTRFERQPEAMGDVEYEASEDYKRFQQARDAKTLKPSRLSSINTAPDIVDQGTGTLYKLAEGLLISEKWFFWWD